MDPGSIRCNLDRIKADFLPMEGVVREVSLFRVILVFV